MALFLCASVASATTFTKYPLSASTNGKGVLVAATASTGTTIHTAVSGTSAWDEVWLYATNNDTASHNLTLQWGSTSAQDNIQLAVPAQSGMTLVIPGFILQNGLVIYAFSDAANKITIQGYANRIQ